MGSSLFSIKAELQDIILQLEEGEATDELVAKLGITEDNLKDKIADYLQVIKRYQCDVKECSDEVARVNQIKKTRDNTLRRLKDAVLEAVLMFGTTSKSGNKVIEAPTYKLFSRNTNSYSPKDFLIADIIKEFYYCIGEYLDEVSTLDSLDLEFLAQVISAQLTAYKIADLEAANQSFDRDEIGVSVSKDDLLAIPTEITISISLSELANEENLPLVKWINEHQHKVDTVHKVTSSLIKSHLDMNANLHIYNVETKTSLTIK